MFLYHRTSVVASAHGDLPPFQRLALVAAVCAWCVLRKVRVTASSPLCWFEPYETAATRSDAYSVTSSDAMALRMCQQSDVTLYSSLYPLSLTLLAAVEQYEVAAKEVKLAAFNIATKSS